MDAPSRVTILYVLFVFSNIRVMGSAEWHVLEFVLKQKDCILLSRSATQG